MLEKEWDLNLDTFEVYDEKYDYLDEKLLIKYTELENDNKDVRTRYMTPPKDSKDLLCEKGKENQCKPYFSISLRSNGKLTTIIRVYPKLLETFGEFGGIMSLLLSVLGFAYFIFHLNQSTKQIKKVIFGEDWRSEKLGAKGRAGSKEVNIELKKHEKMQEEVEDEILCEA